MSSGNQELGFAIRARNEAEATLREVTGQLGLVEGAAQDADRASVNLDSTWDRLQAGVDELGNSLDNLSDKIDPGAGKIDAIAEASGNLERVLIGTKDVMGVLEEQFGINLGPMTEYTQAAADVAGGMEGILGGGLALAQQMKSLPAAIAPVIASTWAHVTALWAQAAAFIAANAPMLIIIATIALVAAGIFLLVKHWDDLTAKYPPLQTAQDRVAEGLRYLRDILMDHVVPALQEAYRWFHENIEPTLLKVAGFIGDLIVMWVELHIIVAEVAIPLIIGALGLLEGPIKAVLGWVEAIISKVQIAIGWLQKLANEPNATPGNGNVGGGGGSFGSSTEDQTAGGAGGGISLPVGAYNQNLVFDPRANAWVYRWEVGLNNPNGTYGDMGTGPAAAIVIQAWDGESVDTWLQRGGAEKIRRAVAGQGAFA